MRLHLFAVLLPMLLLAPASGQAPAPPPPGRFVPPPLVPWRPLPPRLVSPTIVQEYVVTSTVPIPPGSVIASDSRVNRMRITTIVPLLVPAPPPPPPPAPPPWLMPKEKKEAPKEMDAPKKKEAPKAKNTADGTATTLRVKKWTAGRLIEDEDGRQWVLVSGGAISDSPTELAGWKLPSDTDAPVFWTRSGRLFRLVMTR